MAVLLGCGFVASCALVAGVGTAGATSSQVWTQQSPATSPPGRTYPAMAYDAGTGQLILFGGLNGSTYLNDTWEWNGSTWTQLSPSNSPSVRMLTSMGYDPATGQLILFGGDHTSSALGDTWNWNGSNWVQLSPSNSPPASWGASMAYDTSTSQFISFGGYSPSGGELNATWSWNGSTWTQLSPATSPPGRDSASMAYDAATSQLVLFGGSGGGNTHPLGDTWTWNGATWTEQSPAQSPSARQTAPMAYDPVTAQLILFGGLEVSTYYSDTWTWNGSTWTQLSPATSPQARNYASMAYDTSGGQLLLFGGTIASGASLNDTWTWSYPSAIWTQQSPSTSPSARSYPAMAYDAGTGQLILFGGLNGSTYLNDTWEWNGSTWTQLSPSNSPSVRMLTSMGYDPATGQLILFGGDHTSSALGDTWNWNGSNWVQLSPSNSPPASWAASMAYDTSTGQFILFGGASPSSGELNGTWSWNGSTWIQLSPATSPPGRDSASMAYDAATSQLVLFGGSEGGINHPQGDTWTWNGATWTEQSPALSPSARQGAPMAYDPVTAQPILFGGENNSTSYSDTWTWNGSTWTQLSTATSPPQARNYASMAYDTSGGQLLLFGGVNASGVSINDTWTYAAYTVTCSTSAGSAGCADSTSISVGPGTLSVESSPQLYWEVALDGYDQWASASATALSGCGPTASGTSCSGGVAPSLEVIDATGSGSGWALSAYLSPSGLPAGSVLDFDGAGSTIGQSLNNPLSSPPFSSTTPATSCDYGSDCTLASPASACGHVALGFTSCPGYPVDVTASSGATSQVDLYSASAGSGLGAICLASGSASATGCVGSSAQDFYDLGLPANAAVGVLTTTVINLTVSSGP